MKSARFARGREMLGRHWGKLLILQAILLFGLGYLIAANRSGPPAEQQPATKAKTTAKAPAAPQFWTCSMHPQIHQDSPGICPLCAMKLIPVTASSGGMRTLTISPETRALLNIATAPVERKYVDHELYLVGKVDYDETRLGYITAWVNGRLDRLFANFTGIHVRQNDHMVYIYSEELYSAQEELLQALKFARQPGTTRILTDIDMAQSAREKLRNLGLTDAQIKEVETRGTPSYHMTIYAPVSGVVIQKLREEGERVRVGERIYTIADLNHLWVYLDAYEADIEWLRYGQAVTFTTEAYPGETFKGRIAFIQPVLDNKTRTIKVRVNVDNASGKLKPAMFVRAKVQSMIASGGRVMDEDLAGKWISPMHPEIVKDHPGTCDICGMPLVRAETLGYVSAETDNRKKPLVFPATAALLTGTRAIVYVEDPKADVPTFNGREVVLGPRAGDYYIVRSGLAEGELVVTNGNFKIDSEIQIQAKPSMMAPEGGGDAIVLQHGGATKKGNAKNAGTPVVATPFQEELQNLSAAYDSVARALKEADLEKIHQAFDVVGKALNRVDASGLNSRSMMLWNELAMLLNNDVVEGHSVQTVKDAERVLDLLKGHVERVRRDFDLDSLPPLRKRIQVPAEFQVQLGRIWTAYLPMQRALAADNFPDAQRALRQFQPTPDSIDSRAWRWTPRRSGTKSTATWWKLWTVLPKHATLMRFERVLRNCPMS